ncbi:MULTISPECIES: radical SAM protein [Citricoccus]|uniref:radical SAM protein n=1 Tax=Citricoccus TaxID=169133 RepID=UPI000255F121|nr:radical SAM protein [Citricoccus sp. CH26A]
MTGPSGEGARRIVQVHPTLRCNLKCAHCYSSSAPAQKQSLDQNLLKQFLSDAVVLGFDSVSVSGGEPLMYPELEELLTFARHIGLQTGLVTNGTFLTREMTNRLEPLLDVMAISLDGPPELHNRIRGSHQAFGRAVRALDYIANSRIASAVVHTVTKSSLPFLGEVISTARRHGAYSIRLHPLEMHGRAELNMTTEALTPSDRNRLFLQAKALNRLHLDDLRIELDLELRSRLLSRRPFSSPPSGETADDVQVLVVDPAGRVVPVAYGIDPTYQVCNLAEQSLLEGWRDFMQKRYPHLQNLSNTLLDEIQEDSEQMVLNWHETLVARSLSPVASP